MTDALLYIALWLDTAPGWRNYLVLRIGRKWTWLLCTEDASQHRIATPAYAAAFRKARPLTSSPSRMISHLRKVAAAYGQSDSAAVKFALALIRITRTRTTSDQRLPSPAKGLTSP